MIGKSSAEQPRSIELASKKKNFFVVQVVQVLGGTPTWHSIWVTRAAEVRVLITQRMLTVKLVDTILIESHTELEAAYVGEMTSAVHRSAKTL